MLLESKVVLGMVDISPPCPAHAQRLNSHSTSLALLVKHRFVNNRRGVFDPHAPILVITCLAIDGLSAGRWRLCFVAERFGLGFVHSRGVCLACFVSRPSLNAAGEMQVSLIPAARMR